MTRVGEGWTLHIGDCLPIMRGMPDSCIDLIATDPPYFRVKNEPWDRQWDNADKFIAWVGELCQEWRRILKPNGSLYVFASPRMSARVELEIGRWFNVLNKITWHKEHGRHNGSEKGALRSYFPATEAIIFAEHFGADNAAKGEAGYVRACDKARGFVFEPLRAYLDGERRRAGVGLDACNLAIGNERTTMAAHYFNRAQWALPTAKNYTTLRALFNQNGGEYLRREYEYLRRPFYATPERPYTDVWAFPTVQHYPGKHPCEKPLDMMRHIIETSSRPGALVLDCFAGSGVTGEAAVALGRRAILIEAADKWVQTITRRLEAAPLAEQSRTMVRGARATERRLAVAEISRGPIQPDLFAGDAP